ncbi:MAG: HisA/HisF-related TIM barrel protein, partial [Prolixibacteraceae bacterium]|nr:HisA/HisF-related TIM barrel protein [Prolixibacteraceae bacterium]
GLFLDWFKKYGAGKIILGADAKEKKIVVGGWQEVSEIPVIDFIRSYVEEGITQVISTDILLDGMLAGPSMDLYREILENFPGLGLIASGGISSIADIIDLNDAGVPGVITGKAIYEGRISLKEIENFQKK